MAKHSHDNVPPTRHGMTGSIADYDRWSRAELHDPHICSSTTDESSYRPKLMNVKNRELTIFTTNLRLGTVTKVPAHVKQHDSRWKRPSIRRTIPLMPHHRVPGNDQQNSYARPRQSKSNADLAITNDKHFDLKVPTHRPKHLIRWPRLVQDKPAIPNLKKPRKGV